MRLKCFLGLIMFLLLPCILISGNLQKRALQAVVCTNEDWTECAGENIKQGWIEYAPDWEFMKKKNDVLIYKRKLPSGILQCKAEKIIYARAEVIEQLVRDVPAYAEFMHKCFLAETIKEFNDEDLVIHNATAMPWPLQPRDGVVRTHVSKDWDYGRFEVLCYGLHSPESEKWVPKIKGYTRMYEISVYMIAHILDREKAKCFYIIHADPTGVPLIAVNFLMDVYPYETILNFEQMLKREKYVQLGKKSKYLHLIEEFCKRKQNASKK